MAEVSTFRGYISVELTAAEIKALQHGETVSVVDGERTIDIAKEA